MTILTVMLLIATILFFAVLIADNRRFVVRTYTVSSPKIGSPVRIVFLTDLHDKVYGEGNLPVLQAVRAMKPDVVLTGGDLIVFKDAYKGKDSVSNALALMKQIVAEFPVYFVNGNHEQHLLEEADTRSQYDALLERLQEAGVVILNNRSELLQVGGNREDTNVLLQGLALPMDYYERFRFKPVSAETLQRLMGVPAEDKFTLLLAHTPDQAQAYAEWGADLCLCGHLHGGVARLPLIGGVLGPQTGLFPGYSAGQYRIRRGEAAAPMEMIVSCGMGMHKLPVRFLNPGELSVVELMPQKADRRETGANAGKDN